MNSYTPIHATALLEQQRRHLEGIVQRPEATVYGPSRLGQLLRQAGDKAVTWLTTGHEPQVTKVVRRGSEAWKVHDPLTSETHYFTEENEVRTWLEGRFAR